MTYRKTLIGGFLTVAALALAAQDAIPIQRTLVENSVDTYKSTSKVDQTLESNLGEFPITIATATTYSLKTGKVDQAMGTADVELTSTIDSIDGGDSVLTSGLSKTKPQPIVQDGTIDKMGHLTLKAPDKADKMMTIFTGVTGGLQASMFIELPNHPVKVGDSWDIVVPKGSFTGPTDQKVKVTLTGDKTVDGHSDWTVDVGGAVNIDFDSASLADTGPAPTTTLGKTHILAKGTTTVKGTGLIDKATGKTVQLDTTSQLKTLIELPDEGDMIIHGAGTLVTDLKLQS
jgi:hypothetical protein